MKKSMKSVRVVLLMEPHEAKRLKLMAKERSVSLAELLRVAAAKLK